MYVLFYLYFMLYVGPQMENPVHLSFHYWKCTCTLSLHYILKRKEYKRKEERSQLHPSENRKRRRQMLVVLNVLDVLLVLVSLI